MRCSRPTILRSAARRAGLAIVLVVAALLLGSVPASAGGPTSVLIASPQLQRTASAYTSDAEYATLARAVGAGTEEAPQAEAGAPDPVLGPGGTQINVTWLVHDVSVWRVDRIVLGVKGGPWINTLQDFNQPLDFEEPGVWHRSPTPEALVDLMNKWGMVDGSAVAEQPAAVDEAGADGAADGAVDAAGTTGASGTADTTQTRQTASDGSGVGTNWWLAVPLLAIGLAGGALARPAASRLRARTARTRGRPSQELIDA
jgi:hypothetical protein